jgi:hypothetical protein
VETNSSADSVPVGCNRGNLFNSLHGNNLCTPFDALFKHSYTQSARFGAENRRRSTPTASRRRIDLGAESGGWNNFGGRADVRPTHAGTEGAEGRMIRRKVHPLQARNERPVSDEVHFCTNLLPVADSSVPLLLRDDGSAPANSCDLIPEKAHEPVPKTSRGP